MASAKTKSIYSVHPSVAIAQKWVETLPEKSGRSLDEWIELVKTSGPKAEIERRDWLKKNYQLGTNTAWWIAERVSGQGRIDEDPATYLQAAEVYVENMFAGAKTGLLPIYDKLLEAAFKLGKDVKACPCKTMVPLYRNHVFAQLKPATRTRLDLGLSLKNVGELPEQLPERLPERLIDTGGAAKGDRITHCIAISSIAEIDDEVEHWLKRAYQQDE